MPKLMKESIRFLITGGISTLLNYAIYALCIWSQVIPTMAAILGYISGLALGYSTNKAWTFESTKTHRHIVAPYLIIYGLSLGVTIAMTHAFTLTTLSPYLTYVITIGVTTMINFLGCKYWVFRT